MSIRNVPILGITLFCVSGCVAGVEQMKTSLQSDITELRGIQAEHTAAISEIRAEMRSLTGKIEEMQYISQGKAQELERTLRQLGSRVPPPPGVPEELLNKDEDKISSITGPAAEQYHSALAKLRAGDFSGARQLLSDFIDGNPGTAFTDNALFWLGITYGKLGQNDQAIVAFSDVFRTYPAEDMVPPALFYLADTFEKSGSREDAELTLEKLIEEYPRTSFANKGKTKLKRIKRRGRR